MNRSRLLLSSVQNFSSSLEEKEAISEPLENKLYRFQIKNGLPGLSCLISKNYQPIYACNLGHSNLENLSPYQSCTVSRIGSISKVYCMLAIRKLAQEGKIDLNRPIVEYLPWIINDQNQFENNQQTEIFQKINFYDVLRHESGIRHYLTDNEFSDEIINETNLNLNFNSSKDALQFLKLLPADNSKNSIPVCNNFLSPRKYKKFNYSTHAFTYLSAVVEEVSGKSYLGYLRENIFKNLNPDLNLNSTFGDETEKIIANRADGYFRDPSCSSILKNTKEINQSWKYAGGGLISSSLDTIKLGNFLLKDLYEKNDEFVIKFPEHKWLVGLDPSLNGHSGASSGGSCVLYLNPNKKLVIVVLSNMTSGMSGCKELLSEIDGYF